MRTAAPLLRGRQVAPRVPLLEAGTALEAHVVGGFTGKIVLENRSGKRAGVKVLGP